MQVYFIRDLVRAEIINVEHVASEINDADNLTKLLGHLTFSAAVKRLGLAAEPARMNKASQGIQVCKDSC